MNDIPREIAVGEIYVPPLLLSVILALVLTLLTSRWLLRSNGYRFFLKPQLVFMAMCIIYTAIIETVIWPT